MIFVNALLYTNCVMFLYIMCKQFLNTLSVLEGNACLVKFENYLRFDVKIYDEHIHKCKEFLNYIMQERILSNSI